MLLECAKLAVLPEIERNLPGDVTWIDYIYRIVIIGKSIEQKFADEIIKLMNESLFEEDNDTRFLRAAIHILSQDSLKGLKLLKKLENQATHLKKLGDNFILFGISKLRLLKIY